MSATLVSASRPPIGTGEVAPAPFSFPLRRSVKLRDRPINSYLASLAILIPCQTTKTYHAAGHLIAAQMVREDPKPVLDAMGEAL